MVELRTRVWMVAGCAILLAVMFLAPAPADAKEKVVVVGDKSNVSTCDPALSAGYVTINIARNIFMGLTRYKRNSIEVEGDLAESWTVSEDGLVYTFKLRDDVKWHKGFGNVTAHDVKFSFERVADPKTHSPYMGEINIIQEIKVLDDYTVQFVLKGRDAAFLSKCANPKPVAIVCEKAIEKFGKGFGRNPIGSGPFEFVSWSAEEIVLKAYEDYYRGRAEIDKVVYKTVPDMDTLMMALMKGDVDLVWYLSREKKTNDRLEDAGVQVKNIKRGGITVLTMNPQIKPLDDIRVRRAFTHAIDREKIITHVLSGYGEVLNSPLPPGYFGHTTEGLRQYPYDPEKAKKLLAEAGYPNGFEITMISNNLSSCLPPSMAIKDQMAKVGVKINLDVGDNTSTRKKFTSGKVAMFLYTGGRRPNATVLFENFFHKDGFPPGVNLARYDKLDSLIDASRGELDPQKRLELYHKIQKGHMEDLPAIPMFSLYYPAGLRPHLTGLPDSEVVYGIDIYDIHYK